ncbi:hypothetical protein CB1_000683012 [Camelus ferus]|nr:hypothetical protein CB1_000683012 [Camelus ferus]
MLRFENRRLTEHDHSAFCHRRASFQTEPCLLSVSRTHGVRKWRCLVVDPRSPREQTRVPTGLQAHGLVEDPGDHRDLTPAVGAQSQGNARSGQEAFPRMVTGTWASSCSPGWTLKSQRVLAKEQEPGEEKHETQLPTAGTARCATAAAFISGRLGVEFT